MKILIDGPRIGIARTNLKCLGPWNVTYSAAACVMFPKNGNHKNSSIKIWCPLQIHSKFNVCLFFGEKAFFGSIENFYAVIFFVDFEAVQFVFGFPFCKQTQAFERGWPVVAVLLYRKHVVCLGETGDDHGPTMQYHGVMDRSSGWWFQIFFIFTPIWGRFPFWLMFFKWVETTN